MSTPERIDWRIEALAEIEDIRRRLFEVKHLIAEDIRRDDETFRKIMTAVRESDEATTSFGAPCCDPPAKGYETQTHAFAAIQQSGGVCSEAMDDIDPIPYKLCGICGEVWASAGCCYHSHKGRP